MHERHASHAALHDHEIQRLAQQGAAPRSHARGSARSRRTSQCQHLATYRSHGAPHRSTTRRDCKATPETVTCETAARAAASQVAVLWSSPPDTIGHATHRFFFPLAFLPPPPLAAPPPKPLVLAAAGVAAGFSLAAAGLGTSTPLPQLSRRDMCASRASMSLKSAESVCASERCGAPPDAAEPPPGPPSSECTSATAHRGHRGGAQAFGPPPPPARTPR